MTTVLNTKLSQIATQQARYRQQLISEGKLIPDKNEQIMSPQYVTLNVQKNPPVNKKDQKIKQIATFWNNMRNLRHPSLLDRNQSLFEETLQFN